MNNSAIIKINEIVHCKMEDSKNNVLSKMQFYGLTPNLFSYVEMVWRLRNPSLGEVAKELRVSSASASVAIAKLISDGYIKKTRSSQDRRINNLALTKKGEKLIRENKNALGSVVSELNSVLSVQEKEAIEKIYIKLKALHEDEDIKN